MRTAVVGTVAAVVFAGLVGCASAVDSSEELIDEADEVTGTDDAALATGLTYFTVVRDERKCASPDCGGYYVSRVNRASTRCADGWMRARCYVASVDTAATPGLPAEGIASLVHAEREGVEAIFDGAIVPTRINGRAYGLFRPNHVWRAAVPVALDAAVYNVSNEALACAKEPEEESAAQQKPKAPCADLEEMPLNYPWKRVIPGIDFRAAPLANACGLAPQPGELASHAAPKLDLDESFGLLVAGTHDRRGILRVKQYFALQPGVCPANERIRGRGL